MCGGMGHSLVIFPVRALPNRNITGYVADKGIGIITESLSDDEA